MLSTSLQSEVLVLKVFCRWSSFDEIIAHETKVLIPYSWTYLDEIVVQFVSNINSEN